MYNMALCTAACSALAVLKFLAIVGQEALHFTCVTLSGAGSLSALPDKAIVEVPRIQPGWPSGTKDGAGKGV